jgi:hypothetical protein
MTAIENLRALKQQLKAGPSVDEREWIEGELMKIDIALGFLEKEPPSQPIVSR